MKILILTSRYGFGYGMGYASYKEAVALSEQGNSVTVVHCYNSLEINQFCDSRIKTIYLPIKKTPIIGFFVYYFKLNKFFKREVDLNDFDVVYIQSLEFGLLNLSKIKIPIFYFSRSTMIGLRKVLKKEKEKISLLARTTQFILVYLERRCLHYSKLVFVKSPKMVDEVYGFYNVNLDKMVIISGGVDVKDFQVQNESASLKFKHELRIPEKAYVVLYAGRIVPQKGLIYLIKASLNLFTKFDFIVVIAGASSNKNYVLNIKKLIDKSIYKNNFYWLGHVNQLNMTSVFNLADCLVTPSLYEPFGMVNLQAAFLNKNIVTTNVTGSIDLLVNYPKMKVVESASSASIESELREILLLKKDVLKSIIKTDGYSWDNVAKQLSQHFLSSK